LKLGPQRSEHRRKSAMPTVKTAISLPEPLFKRAETVAHELQIREQQRKLLESES
jgi:hypothetical protein